MVRNDNTPDRKKYLGILRKEQMVKNPETQEEYAIACDGFYALFKKHYSQYIGIINPVKCTPPYGVSAGKRDQIDKKNFFKVINILDQMIKSTSILLRNFFLKKISIWSLFSALTPSV